MLKTILLFACIEFVQSENMESFVVGGKEVDITLSSHSAFMSIQMCKVQCENWVSVCGASILNQNIVISAAHCFENFDRHSKVTVRAGHSNKGQGAVRHVSRILVHYKYDYFTVENDIALAYFKRPFQLGSRIKRVSVMKDLPKTNVGYIAGWGVIDEIKKQDTNILRRVKQRLWSRNECKKILRKIPQGILCGGTQNSNEYPSEGDSGSALVVNDYIQVGLVSFKKPEITRSIVIYTDLSYFYKWITNAAKKIYCV